MSVGKKWFIVMSIFAIAAVVSFFQINSAWADKHHFNTGWLVIGIILSVCAIGSLYKVTKNTN